MSRDLRRKLVSGPHHDRRRALFEGDRATLRVCRWVLLALLVILYPTYGAISPWLGVAFFLAGVVLAQLALSIQDRPPYLQVMLFYYLLVFGLASLALQYLRPSSLSMRIRPEDYP